MFLFSLIFYARPTGSRLEKGKGFRPLQSSLFTYFFNRKQRFIKFSRLENTQTRLFRKTSKQRKI